MRRSADFRRVLESRHRSRRGAVTVVASPGGGDSARVGLIVRRDVGNAVRRNRAKRRVRHALAEIPLEKSMDYVIIAGSRVVDAPFTQLTTWLSQAVGDLRR